MHALILYAALIGPHGIQIEEYRVGLLDVMILNQSTTYVNFWSTENGKLVGRGWHLSNDHPGPHMRADGLWCYEFVRSGIMFVVFAPQHTVTWAVEDYEARFRNGGGKYRPIGR